MKNDRSLAQLVRGLAALSKPTVAPFFWMK
jgi:hypothetical protein